MSHWNYRVIEFVSSDGEPWRSIHEVHYSDDGSTRAYGEEPASVTWDTSEGDEAALRILDRMTQALTKPILVESDFSYGSDARTEGTEKTPRGSTDAPLGHLDTAK